MDTERISPTAASSETAIRQEFMLPARDGIGLKTYIFRPRTGAISVPTLVIRTPYAEMTDMLTKQAETFCRKGYATVFQLCRGTGGSEGEWIPYIHEKRDGQDLLQYLEGERWCKSIGLVGTSYLSLNAWLLSDCPTPKVKTAFLGNFGLDRHYSAYSGGLFRHDILTGWSMMNAGFAAKGTYEESCRHWPMITTDTEVWGGRLDWYRDYLSHPCSGDPYWDEGFWGEVRRLGKNVKFPSLCMVEGWFDHHLGSAIRSYEWLSDEMRAHTRFVVGPWNHGYGIEAAHKQIESREDLSFGHLMETWMDEVLLREEAPVCDVRFYEIGANRWRRFDSFPRAATEKILRFRVKENGEKRLIPMKKDPTGADELTQTVSYRYDPKDPAPSCGGETMLVSQKLLGCKKQPGTDYRADVLSFVSEPFDEALSLAGSIAVHLKVASTAKDTAFCAKICEEQPDGSAYNLRTTICALGFRGGSDHYEAYTPGTFVELELKATDIAWRFDAGSRIRVDISSSDFPQYAAHPNSDALWCTVTEPVTATQTLCCADCTLSLPIW